MPVAAHLAPRPRARRVPPATIALLGSLTAHAMAAAAASVVLPLALPAQGHEVAVEVDLASADRAAAPEAEAAPPRSALPRPDSKSALKPRGARTSADHGPMREITAATPTVTPSLLATTSSASGPIVAVEATPSARFTLSMGTVPAPAPGPTSPRMAAVAGQSGPTGSDVVGEKDVEVAARPIWNPKPPYPPQAERAEVEGDVPLQIVIDTDGRVVEAHSISRCGYGLDEAAEQAIRAWRFSPALRHGRPVRVRMRWPFQFRLR